MDKFQNNYNLHSIQSNKESTLMSQLLGIGLRNCRIQSQKNDKTIYIQQPKVNLYSTQSLTIEVKNNSISQNFKEKQLKKRNFENKLIYASLNGIFYKFFQKLSLLMGSCVARVPSKKQTKLPSYHPPCSSAAKTYGVSTYPSIEDVLREENRNLGKTYQSQEQNSSYRCK